MQVKFHSTLTALSLLLCMTPATAGSYGISDRVISNFTQTTYHDLQNKEVVRQQYDYSCGAASLATILKYQFDIDIDEKTVVIEMLESADDQARVRKHGFSLLDLKRYAQRWGIQGAGYSGLSVKELADKGLPAIVPVKMDGFDHFVVYKGEQDDHVYIGDPSSGNMLLEAKQFDNYWQNNIAFFLFREDQANPNLLNDSDAYLISDWQHPTYTNTRIIQNVLHNIPR